MEDTNKKEITEFKDRYNNVLDYAARMRYKIEELAKHFDIESTNQNSGDPDFVRRMLYSYFEGARYQKIDHIFTDNYLLYIVIFSMCLSKNKDSNYYEELDNYLYMILDANTDNLIYYYSFFFDYFGETYSSFYLHPPYVKPESTKSLKEIYKELFTPEEEKMMERYERCYDEEIVKKTKYKQEFLTAKKILSVIASYCVVNKEYDKFNGYVNHFMKNCYEIIKKFELDGVAQMIDGNDITIESEEFIQYIINVVLGGNNKQIR